MVLNSLNFCLSERLFISPSILNEILTGYSNLDCRFFPFSTLNISYHSLLACRVSAERSAVKHMGFPLPTILCAEQQRRQRQEEQAFGHSGGKREWGEKEQHWNIYITICETARGNLMCDAGNPKPGLCDNLEG